MPDGRRIGWLHYGSGHLHQISVDGKTICDIERDPLHREIGRSQGALTSRYGHDAQGRLVSQQVWRQGPLAGARPSPPRPAWEALGDELDPLTGTRRRLPAGPTEIARRYQYDGAGNLLQIDDARAGITRRPDTEQATTQTTRFEYDALGRRIARTDAFGRTEFIWEGMRLIEERRGAQASAYVYEPGSYVPLARIDAGGGAGEPGQGGAANDGGTSGAAANTPGDDALPGARVYYFHTDPSGLSEELSDPDAHPLACRLPRLGQHGAGELGGHRSRWQAAGTGCQRAHPAARTEPALPGPVPGSGHRAALQHLPLL